MFTRRPGLHEGRAAERFFAFRRRTSSTSPANRPADSLTKTRKMPGNTGYMLHPGAGAGRSTNKKGGRIFLTSKIAIKSYFMGLGNIKFPKSSRKQLMSIKSSGFHSILPKQQKTNPAKAFIFTLMITSLCDFGTIQTITYRCFRGLRQSVRLIFRSTQICLWLCKFIIITANIGWGHIGNCMGCM